MKQLLFGLVILLPVIASADVTLNLDTNNYRGNDVAVFTGEDAEELRTFIGKKSFAERTIRGVHGIICHANECKISFNGDIYSKFPTHDQIQRENPELNTFFKSFTPSESENLVSIPSHSWYYHGRDEVLTNDKALFKYLSSKKNAVKGELDGNKTISIEGKNFKLSCVKNKKPERYEMAKCLGPHGGCLPSVFSKFIRITHQCRSYLKATPAN